MTTLVTGGRGFLASHLAAELRRRHPSGLVALLDLVPGPGTVVCDLRSPEAARREVLRLKPSCIYHLAGTTRPLGWEGLWDAHVATTVNLLTAVRALPCAQRPRVVVCGSSAEYGRPRGGPVREGDLCEPVTPYGASKHSQSLAALSFRHEGVLVIVARPFNVIGPGMLESLALGTFARQLARIARGEQPPVLKVGDLLPRRDFVDVRDVARALADLGRLGVPGEVYNISSGRAVAMAALLRELLEVTGLRVRVRTDPSRVRRQEVRTIIGDHRKLSALSGWKPAIPLARTLRDLWAGLAAAVLAVGLALPSAAKAPPVGPESVFGPESSGTEVSLPPGRRFTIKLPGNPTTGYQWTVAKAAGDSFRQVGELEYRPSAGSAGMVGAGGEYSVSFRAVSTGTTEIRLDYGRSWEKAPERSFSLRAVCAIPPKDITAVFLCPDGSRIRARFLLKEDAVRLDLPGRKVTLKRALSASGARYEGEGVEFWNKGDDARVTEGGREYTCRSRR